MEVSGQLHPRRKSPRYPLYRRLGRSQSRSARVGKKKKKKNQCCIKCAYYLKSRYFSSQKMRLVFLLTEMDSVLLQNTSIRFQRFKLEQYDTSETHIFYVKFTTYLLSKHCWLASLDSKREQCRRERNWTCRMANRTRVGLPLQQRSSLVSSSRTMLSLRSSPNLPDPLTLSLLVFYFQFFSLNREIPLPLSLSLFSRTDFVSPLCLRSLLVMYPLFCNFAFYVADFIFCYTSHFSFCCRLFIFSSLLTHLCDLLPIFVSRVTSQFLQSVNFC